jgi:hypothetical protein
VEGRKGDRDPGSTVGDPQNEIGLDVLTLETWRDDSPIDVSLAGMKGSGGTAYAARAQVCLQGPKSAANGKLEPRPQCIRMLQLNNTT